MGGVSLDSCMMLDDVAAVRDGESDAVLDRVPA